MIQVVFGDDAHRHGEQQDIAAIFLRQQANIGQDALGVFGAVQGHQQPLEAGAPAAPVAGGAQEQDGRIAQLNDPAGDAANEQAFESGTAVGTHHNQILFLRRLIDGRDNRALGRHRAQRQPQTGELGGGLRQIVRRVGVLLENGVAAVPG